MIACAVRRGVRAPARLLRLAALIVVIAALLAPLAARTARAAEVWTVRTFDTDEQVMVLTFDAGSDRGYTGTILDTLAAKGVRATFGMTGVWAQANPDLITRIAAEGHTFINHSWDHKSFPGLTSSQRADQLRRTENIVREQIGVELQPYFRPPFGEYNDSVLTDLAANGYTVNVMWTVDTLGWAGRSATEIKQRVLDTATPGGIVLMHVGAASQDAAALPGMIDDLRARGYRFATVQELAEGVAASRYFPETGHWVNDNFLRYWERFGGLAVFGYPITGAFDQDGLVVQYFERARLELHPGSWPARYDVLQGLLGVELFGHRLNEQPFRPISAASDANCTFYRETGHRLCSGFRAWWQAHGGLAIFGYPISEEFKENGVTVQYFERARFEWHPENKPPWNVLLGHLGRLALE